MSPPIEADTSLGSGQVTRVLGRLVEERDQPERPMQNGHVESLHGQLRYSRPFPLRISR